MNSFPPPNIDEIILDLSNDDEIEDSNIDEDTEEIDDIFMQADEDEEGEIEILEEENGEKLKKKIKISKPIRTHGLKNKMLNALYNSLIKYWTIITPQIGLLASVLDPRFKSLKFASSHREITCKVLSEELDSIKEKNPENRRRPTVVIQKTSQNTIFDELLGSTQIINDNELEKYLNITNVAGNIDPLIWWKEKKNDFPNLAILASKYLCLSATSVPSERLFSDVGNHITNKRNRLSSKIVSDILFLKRNMKLFPIFD